MIDDALTAFKLNQKKSWGLFAPLEIVTTMPAASLVRFSSIKSGQSMLDVACGTGVVAITAAKLGLTVSGFDLSPVLIDYAIKNAAIAGVNVSLQEADVEEIPYPDHSFDVVLSQFGHMFAPRPEFAIREMLRVLKPGGTIAFSTWPSHLFVGNLLNLSAKYSPPPEGVSSPSKWGDTSFIREQMADSVDNLVFDQGVMLFPTLSLSHYRQTVEETIGPILKFVNDSQNNPAKLKQFRSELEALASPYFKDNHIQQHFLMTRAKKKQ